MTFEDHELRGPLRFQRPYRPKLPDRLSRFPSSQRANPVEVHELRLSWLRREIDKANTTEPEQKAEANRQDAAEEARAAYHNRKEQRTQ